MSTVLIIICIILGLTLFSLLAPAVIGAFCAWFCFWLDLPAAGMLSIIVGLIAQCIWIVSFFSGEVGFDSYDSYDDYDMRANQSDDTKMSLVLGAFLVGKSIGSKDK